MIIHLNADIFAVWSRLAYLSRQPNSNRKMTPIVTRDNGWLRASLVVESAMQGCKL